MTTPPIAPLIIIGAKAFVMIASGRLISSPTINPFAQLGNRRSLEPIKNPIAKRLANAAVKAAVLSSKCNGIISNTSTIPKTTPHTMPNVVLVIRVK